MYIVYCTVHKKHKYKYLAGIHSIMFTVNDEFIIKGSLNETYRISDFIIRPFNKDVLAITKHGDTLSINSFPCEY